MKKLIIRLLLTMAIILGTEAALQAGNKTEAKSPLNLGTLASNGSTKICWNEEENEEFAYIQFQAKKDGYITFHTANLPENTGLQIRGTWFLCNSSKKEISSADDCGFWIGDSITFAVKQKCTYFLKVRLYGYDGLLVNYEYKAVKDKSGNKKANAYKLKKKKAISGLLMAGENKTDWYKLTLSKKQVLKLTLTTKSYRGIQLDVFDNKGRQLNGLSVYQPASADEKVTVASRNGRYKDSPYTKLPKGTYYVKVYCLKGAKGCGYYSLSWK